MLMAVGFGLVFLAIVFTNLWNPIGWIGLAMIIIGALFGGSKCKPKEVTFECKPWKAPVGGDNCEKCNDDPLKPCSGYRCNSLGAACELINKGTEQELCHSSKDDGKAPILRPQIDTISETEMYDGITDGGFGITDTYGGCIDAYTPLVFGIVTD